MRTFVESPPISESIITEAFQTRVRNSLKGVLMKKAEEEIEKIVDRELEALKVHVQTYHDKYMGSQMINFLISKEGF